MAELDLFGLSRRPPKPRHSRLTCVIDTGLGVEALRDSCESWGEMIDFVKFGWGTGLVSNRIKEKIKILDAAEIGFWFGGTLFELFYANNHLDSFTAWVEDMGARYFEISDGTLELSSREKINMIERLSKRFHVISEVGSKDPLVFMPPCKWVEKIRDELNAGAFKVIAEGRESGTAGIFKCNGEIQTPIIDAIMASDVNINDLIFEAPIRMQQIKFIKMVGPHVNFGNIPMSDVVNVETMRLGLRSDTINVAFCESSSQIYPAEIP